MSEPSGFYNLKEPILMIKKGDPNYKPDWSNWGKDDRQIKQLQAAMSDPEVAVEVQKAVSIESESAAPTAPVDPFSTVIAGPWMGRWEMFNHNKHTDQFKRDRETGGTTWHSEAASAFG